MKILFLSGWYPGRVNLHLGNFVQKHAEAVALGAEVAALSVCSDISCKEKYEFEQNIINNVFTVNVYYKKVNHHFPLVSQGQRAWRYLRAHFAGWKIIKNKFGKPDVVHHNILYPAGIFAWLLKQLYGLPYIVTEHSTEYLPTNKTPFSRIRKMGSKLITKGAYCITTVTENLKQAMMSRGFNANYRIVYNVVNTDLFVPRKDNLNRSKFKLIHISTLNDKHKNISGMLRTIARLTKQRNDFECLLMGDGDTSPHIELAKTLGIYNSTAFFDGEKTTVEIAAIMSDADAFFMFSHYENLPVVILEAFACGIPVLSSDVGGIAEHINGDNGLLVPAGDEEALLKAFNTMLDNLKEKKYKSEALRDYAVKNFSYKEVSNKFHQIYSEIVKHV